MNPFLKVFSCSVKAHDRIAISQPSHEALLTCSITIYLNIVVMMRVCT